MPNIVYLHSSYPKKDFGEASFFLPCILLYIQMVLREWTWSLGNSSIPFLHTCSFPLRMLYLQRGHVAFILSHFTMHVEWKWWLQGRAWSSVPSSYELRHMQHSYEKKKYWSNQSPYTIFYTYKLPCKCPWKSNLNWMLHHTIHDIQAFKSHFSFLCSCMECHNKNRYIKTDIQMQWENEETNGIEPSHFIQIGKGSSSHVI